MMQILFSVDHLNAEFIRSYEFDILVYISLDQPAFVLDEIKLQQQIHFLIMVFTSIYVVLTGYCS